MRPRESPPVRSARASTTTTGLVRAYSAPPSRAWRSSARSSWPQSWLRRSASLLPRRTPPTAPWPSSSCRRSRRPRTPTAVRSACSCPAQARPSPASGRSPRSCAAASSRRSSTSTARRRSSSRTARPRRRSTSRCRPQGSHHNVMRYPVAIVGPGYRGLLTSGSTRIDGLVSLADIAPTAKAIAAGKKPPIRSRADGDAAATLARLDMRLARAHDARTGATLVLVGWLVAFAALGILARRRSRAVPPCSSPPSRSARRSFSARSASTSPSTVVAIARGRHGRRLVAARPPAWRCSCPRSSCFLWRSSSCSPPGRRSTRWRRSARIPTAADGSTASRTRSRRSCSRRHSPPRRRPASPAPWRSGSCSSFSSAGAAPGRTGEGFSSSPRRSPCCSPGSRGSGYAGAGRRSASRRRSRSALAIVGVDALLGGSSHVTDAVGGGPGTLFDDLDRRLRISWAGATSARRTRRSSASSRSAASRGSASAAATQPAIVAMLVAIGVSLLVNDTPVDVLGYGALGCLALTAWAETRSRERRSASALRLRAAFQSRKSTPRIDATGRAARRRRASVVRRTVPSLATREAARARRPVRRPVRRDRGSGRGARRRA